MDSLWLEKCMISQSFEPSRESRGRVAKVLVQKLLRVVEAEKQGLKNRVWPHLGECGCRIGGGGKGNIFRMNLD